MAETLTPAFAGMVAIVPIKSNGRMYQKGEIIPGAENWTNIHVFVGRGHIAPAVVIPAAGVSLQEKNTELESPEDKQDPPKVEPRKSGRPKGS